MQKFIHGFVTFSIRFHKIIVAGAVLLIAAALLVASGMVVDSGMENLLPAESPVLKASREMEAEFGGQDSVIVVVQGDGSRCEAFLEELAGRISLAGIANNLFYRVDPALLEQYAPLYLSAAAYRQLESELADPESALSLYLDNPAFPALSRLFRQRLAVFPEGDRLALLNQFNALVLPPAETADADPASSAAPEAPVELLAALLFGDTAAANHSRFNSGTGGYIVSDNGAVYLMLIKPRIAMENFIEDRNIFFTTLRELLDETLSRPGYGGLQAGYTGGQMVVDYEADNIAFDSFVSTALATIVLILLLIMISFRRLLVPLAAGLPLILGTALAAALAVILYESISFFSLCFAALLLGLGIDFAIHLIARYSESRSGGAVLQEALESTLNHTGKAMVIGAATTAVVFAAFLLADFKAFAQMGVICAAGILLTLLSMLTVMPAILAWADRGKEARPYRDTEYRFLAPVGRGLRKYGWAVVLAVAVLLFLNRGAVTGVDISTNLRALFPGDLPSLDWLETVQEHFDYNPDTISLAADSLNDLKHKTAVLAALPGVSGTGSILEFLPPDQEYKAHILREAGSRYRAGLARAGQDGSIGPVNPAAMAEALAGELSEIAAAAEGLGVPPGSPAAAALIDYAALLRGAGGSGAAAALYANLARQGAALEASAGALGAMEIMDVEDLPEDILSNYRSASGKYLLEITPSGSIWDQQFLQRLQDNLAQNGLGTPSGMPYIFKELLALVQSDVTRITAIAAAIVALMLLIFFRSIKDTVLTMITVGATMLLTIALGPLFGISFNIVNLAGLPLIIGIGVDSGVHFAYRLRAGGTAAIPETLVHTGWAVTMTTLTTITGFGSLIFTDHPGLADFGKVIVLGMSLCLLLTLTLLPSSYALVEQLGARLRRRQAKL